MADVSALTNRSIRSIHTELEFLADLNLISQDALQKIHGLLPSVNAISSSTTQAKEKWTPAAAVAALVPPKPALPIRAPKSPTPTASAVVPAPAIPPPPDYDTSKMIVTAEYEYSSDTPGDLQLKVGDTVVVSQHTDKDWWSGRCTRTGQEGWFPRNRVVIVSDGDKKGLNEKKADDNMMMNVAHNRGDNSGFSGSSSGDQEDKGKSKFGEQGKKFGSKLGNAAIFGAGATIGGKIVNGIF